MEDESAISDAAERKMRSIERLSAEQVPVLATLPEIASAAEVTIRPQEDVVARALCLLTVALKGEGLEQELVEKLIGRYELDDLFSPKESVFIARSTFTSQDRINATWRYEAAWVMLWALGFVSALDRPDHLIDVPTAVTLMRERSLDQFRATARLRPKEEVLDEADLIYRYHWAVADARLNAREAPAGLDSGVVYERHYALNWLICNEDQDWDDVSTDT